VYIFDFVFIAVSYVCFCSMCFCALYEIPQTLTFICRLDESLDFSFLPFTEDRFEFELSNLASILTAAVSAGVYTLHSVHNVATRVV